MPSKPIDFNQSTIKNPQNTKAINLLSQGVDFINTTLVHFPDGKLTPIPNFIPSSSDGIPVVGVVRAQHATVLKNLNNQGAHYLFGSHKGLFAEYKNTKYNITPLKIIADALLSNNPISTNVGSNIIAVSWVGHGQSANKRIKLTGATGVGGYTAGEINAEHIILSIIDADNFMLQMNTPATIAANGGGAGINVFTQIDDGVDYSSLVSGYGAGVHNKGFYGASQTSASLFLLARIWSFANFGNGIIACEGNYQGKSHIYDWNGDYKVAPKIMLNSPDDCQFAFVLNGRVIALCGANIKIAGLDNVLAPIWSGIGYNEIPVMRSSQLLSGFQLSDKSAIIFAPDPYLLTFDGGVPDLLELGQEFAIAAPMACCRFEDGLIWYGIDGNYYFYNGGTVQTIINQPSGEYIRGALNQNALANMFMMPDQKHNQVWHYFPTGSSKDPNEYVIINPKRYSPNGGFSFTLGVQSRTSAQRPTVISGRYYMFDKNVQYTAFTSQVRNFAWSAETAYFYLEPYSRVQINYLEPNFFQGNRPINIRIRSIEGAHSLASDYGVSFMASNNSVIHTRAGGKLFSLVISGNGDALIQELSINYEIQGGRGR